MPVSFVAKPNGLPQLLRHPTRRRTVCGRGRRATSSRFSCLLPERPKFSLYDVLGLPETNDPSIFTQSQIRKAYLQKAKEEHPDVNVPTEPSDEILTSGSFSTIARAWRILSDPELRKIYDEAGDPGLDAVESMRKRSDQLAKTFGDVLGDELDFLSDTGQLVGTLLSPSKPAADDTDRPPERHDVCPRSVSEAIWNLRNSNDDSVKYYTLWWIYRFKVREVLPELVDILRIAPCTESSAHPLRRRAALAVGVIAPPPTESSTDTIDALTDVLELDDYFLRYRAAEAIANIGYRGIDLTLQKHEKGTRSKFKFPSRVADILIGMLERGSAAMERRSAASSGFEYQESLFDLDELDPEVRDRLEKVFHKRRENEQRKIRTTMTPQLGVNAAGSAGDEDPYEWVIKAVSAVAALHSDEDKVLESRVINAIQPFVSHDVPLVRYAACKALYLLTGESKFVTKIIDALQFGVEHHYSQRVLIRDLGDLGYWQGARAVAECPMVENSFKILGLKNMLTKLDYDSTRPEVREVLAHMDSLL